MTTSSAPAPLRLALGRRPRHRDADAVQFGLDPDDAVVLVDLSPPLVALVDALDGSRPTAEVVAEAVARGAAPAEVDAVLAALGAGKLLGPPVAGPGGAYVRVHGAGRLGVALARLLAAAGVGRVAVRATGPVAPDDLGTGLRGQDLGRPAVVAAAELVAREAPGVVVAEPARRRPDLVVLTDGFVADPQLTARLTARLQPHLALSASDGVGVVGPLVLPGRTSCLRCADLARAAADPAWPRLAAQRFREPAPRPALASAVAALAAEHVLAALPGLTGGAPGAPPGLADAVVELDLGGGAPRGAAGEVGLRRRARPPHPGCPCRGSEVVGAGR